MSGAPPAGVGPSDASQMPGTKLLEVPASFASIKVEPKADEENDANFPRNLHNAAELFLRAGLVANAAQLQGTVERFFKLLEEGPDGRTTHSLGRACVCWGCGHVGLPANSDQCSERGQRPQGVCAACGDSDQTNFVRAVQKDGTAIPWLQFKSKAPLGAPGGKKVAPNAPCPCGGGKKAKKCCYAGGGTS